MLAKVRQATLWGAHHASAKHTVLPLYPPNVSYLKKNRVSGVPSATAKMETPQILLICVDQLENR